MYTCNTKIYYIVYIVYIYTHVLMYIYIIYILIPGNLVDKRVLGWNSTNNWKIHRISQPLCTAGTQVKAAFPRGWMWRLMFELKNTICCKFLWIESIAQCCTILNPAKNPALKNMQTNCWCLHPFFSLRVKVVFCGRGLLNDRSFCLGACSGEPLPKIQFHNSEVGCLAAWGCNPTLATLFFNLPSCVSAPNIETPNVLDAIKKH